MRALFRTLRPQQWVKNVLFVGAALVFSRHLGDAAYLVRSALAIAAFCALSGAVYAFNDVRDVALDRAHPTKQHRPIAAGELAERTALIWAIALAVVTSLAYVAYTVDGHTVAFFGTDRLVLSAPFVSLGLVRYLFLALWYPKDEPPTEAMLKDPWFLLDVVAAIAAVLYVIYG